MENKENYCKEKYWFWYKEKIKKIMQMYGLPNVILFFYAEKLPFPVPLKYLSMATALIK